MIVSRNEIAGRRTRFDGSRRVFLISSGTEIVAEVANDAKVMKEEPFGPMAIIRPFRTFDDAVKEANRFPLGIAACVWTRSAQTANVIPSRVETGIVLIEPYLNPKFAGPSCSGCAGPCGKNWTAVFHNCCNRAIQQRNQHDQAHRRN